jgi:hypothetical protein
MQIAFPEHHHSYEACDPPTQNHADELERRVRDLRAFSRQ